MKKITLLVYAFAISISFNANADDEMEACATTTENGGLLLAVLVEPVDATEWGFPRPQSEINQEAAENAQEIFGNNMASNSQTGITFQYTVGAGSAGRVINLPSLAYTGQTSFEHFIRDTLNGTDTPSSEDPSPCDPEQNATNNSENNNETAGGGGSSGGGYVTGGSLWPGVIYQNPDTIRYGDYVDCQVEDCSEPPPSTSSF